MYISIKKKILVFSLGIVLFIAGAVSISISYIVKAQINFQIKRELLEAINIFSEFQKFKKNILLSNMKMIATNPDLVRSMAIANNVELKEKYDKKSFIKTLHNTVLISGKNINKEIQSDIFIIIDKKNTLLANLQKEDIFGLDLSPIEMISDVVKGKFISGMYSMDDDLYQISGSPVYFGKYHELIGAIIIGYKIDKKTSLEIKKMTTIDISFFLDDKIFASTLNSDKKTILKTILTGDRKMMNEVLIGKKRSNFINYFIEEEDYLSVIVPLDNVLIGAGFVVLQRSKKEGKDFIYKINKSLILVTVFAILFCLIIGYFITNGIVYPINMLLKSTKSISAGDLDKEIKVNTNDEIRDLANSFDEMRGHLKVNIKHLEEAKNTLEYKVVKRTEEIEDAKHHLENQNKQIIEAQETLLRTTRLASIGEMAGQAGHEILNPVTSIYGRVEKLLNSIQENHGNSDLDILNEIVVGWNGEYEKGGLEGLFNSLKEVVDIKTNELLIDDDLRNFSEIVKEFIQLEQVRKKDLTFINKELMRITNIVNQMRTLSRYSSNKQNLNIENILNETLIIMEDSIVKRNIVVKREYSEEKLFILGDKNELIQAFINLFRNSLDAIESNLDNNKKKAISVSTIKNGAKIEIRIGDSGIGIKEKDLPLIFESNFTTKRPEEGTGLGMGITRRFIRAYGGDIIVEEAKVDIGTTFLIWFPLINLQAG